MTAQKKIEELLIHLGINAKVFSESLGYYRPQIIYDIQKGKTKRISEELANKIVSVFPEISRSWLLADEGDMLKGGIKQTPQDDNVPSIVGNNMINISTLDKALDEIAAMRKLLEQTINNNKEQADRFFAIIERMQGV